MTRNPRQMIGGGGDKTNKEVSNDHKRDSKNKRETFRVSIEEYRGRRFVDCRAYYQDTDGTLKPTKKGIALNMEILGEAIQALQEAINILIEKEAE